MPQPKDRSDNSQIRGISLEELGSQEALLEDLEEGPRASKGETRSDGRMELTVDPRGMEVLVDLFPPLGKGAPLALEQVLYYLDQSGVVQGIDVKTIQAALMESQVERRPSLAVMAARATPALDEVPEYWELLVPLEAAAPEASGNSLETVDYREYTTYQVIKKGQFLARKSTYVPGKEGKDVFGKPLFPSSQKVPFFIPGKNIHTVELPHGRFMVAAIDGKLELEGKTLNLSAVLEIAGSLDYRTGNVRFPGDVLIRGGIRGGFQVECEQNLHCAEAAEVSRIQAGGKIFCKGGLIGQGFQTGPPEEMGLVKCAGDLTTHFVEYCRVLCGGNMLVEKEILGCRVHCEGRLFMGPKGRIAASELFVQGDVEADQIGLPGAEPCQITCGMDTVVLEELRTLQESIHRLIQELREGERLLQYSRRHPDAALDREHRENLLQAVPHAQNQKEALARLGEEQKTKQAELQHLMALIRKKGSHLDRQEEAQIRVKGKVLAFTRIEICHTVLTLEKTLVGVGFRLDKARGQVEIFRL